MGEITNFKFKSFLFKLFLIWALFLVYVKMEDPDFVDEFRIEQTFKRELDNDSVSNVQILNKKTVGKYQYLFISYEQQMYDKVELKYTVMEQRIQETWTDDRPEFIIGESLESDELNGLITWRGTLIIYGLNEQDVSLVSITNEEEFFNYSKYIKGEHYILEVIPFIDINKMQSNTKMELKNE